MMQKIGSCFHGLFCSSCDHLRPYIMEAPNLEIRSVVDSDLYKPSFGGEVR